MAGNSVDLMFKLFGHDATASKALKNVGKEAETVSSKLGHIAKVSAASFAATGAAVVAFSASAVKAAMDDQKSQVALAKTLQNTVHATKAQIGATEDFITKMQLSTGVADDQLRPAFARLTRSTHNLAESQNLMQIAMDISKSTGKDLGNVANALGKAYDGNYGALTRLGVPIDKNILKTKDFHLISQTLAEQFAGSSAASAKTFSGKLDIMKQSMNEAKESIGYAILNALQPMAEKWLPKISSGVTNFVNGLTGQGGTEGLNKAVSDGQENIYNLGEKTRAFFKMLSDHKDMLKNIALIIGSIFIGAKAGAAVQAMITALSSLKTALVGLEAAAAMTAGAEAAATGGASVIAALPAIGAIAAVFGIPALLGMYDAKNGGKVDQGKQWKGAKSGTGDFTGKVVTTKGPEAQGGDSWRDIPGTRYNKWNQPVDWDPVKKAWYSHSIGGKPIYGPDQVPVRAIGGPVAAGSSYLVGERGPELFTPGFSGMITPNNKLGGAGVNVVVNVHGSVVTEHDLAVSVRDQIAQLMRRRGLNPAVIGV